MTSSDQPLLVPLRHASDAPRVGAVAVTIANAYGLAVDFMTIIGPEDDAPSAVGELASAVSPLVDAAHHDVRCRLVVSAQTGESFLDLCTGQMVCMATSASPFDHEHFVGSHAAGLLSRSSAPVVLIGPSVPDAPLGRPQEVVAAVSGEIESNAVLPHARRLAEVLSTGVSKIHVDPDSGTIYETHYEEATEYLPESVHATMGTEPADADAITDALVERAEGSILAVATHARNGLAWIAEGSIAFAAIHRLRSPVLAVGPNIDGIALESASPDAREVMTLESDDPFAASSEAAQRLTGGEIGQEFIFSYPA